MHPFFKLPRHDSRDLAIKAYAAVLVVAAAGLVIGIIATQEFSPGRTAWPLIGFGLLAIMAERQSVRFTENIQLSVSFLPLLFVAVVFWAPPAAPFLAVLVVPPLCPAPPPLVIFAPHPTVISRWC